jgi:hypothetical protein
MRTHDMPNRWPRLEGVYHDAPALPPTDRAAFLDDACAGDATLRAEIEALLAHADTAFLDGGVAVNSAFATAEHEPRLTPGTKWSVS